MSLPRLICRRDQVSLVSIVASPGGYILFCKYFLIIGMYDMHLLLFCYCYNYIVLQFILLPCITSDIITMYAIMITLLMNKMQWIVFMFIYWPYFESYLCIMQ